MQSQFAYRFLHNTMLNIIMLMMLGIMIPLVFEKYSNNVILAMYLGCMFSTAIELIQYLSWRGTFEIQDILFNTIGCLLGYAIYRIILKSLSNKYERWTLEVFD